MSGFCNVKTFTFTQQRRPNNQLNERNLNIVGKHWARNIRCTKDNESRQFWNSLVSFLLIPCLKDVDYCFKGCVNYLFELCLNHWCIKKKIKLVLNSVRPTTTHPTPIHPVVSSLSPGLLSPLSGHLVLHMEGTDRSALLATSSLKHFLCRLLKGPLCGSQ